MNNLQVVFRNLLLLKQHKYPSRVSAMMHTHTRARTPYNFVLHTMKFVFVH